MNEPTSVVQNLQLLRGLRALDKSSHKIQSFLRPGMLWGDMIKQRRLDDGLLWTDIDVPVASFPPHLQHIFAEHRKHEENAKRIQAAYQAVHRDHSERERSHQDREDRERDKDGHKEKSHRKEKKSIKNKIIPLEEDTRRLFQECKIGMGNTSRSSQAVGHTKPEELDLEADGKDAISEFQIKCMSSQERIAAQIPWATASADRSRRERRKGRKH
ncbi:hypothetical protein D9758_015022 [Tetrapyrgos nigripes]|uniref:Uncharacterized protein n=1 Tax=Tetrapyrgos nigripes TaxID=182062 RepID=A0A8H5CFN5_9AGAR|nr:hypothetical protein D9758_015022 [Tetrapyrgos nigripes]